MRAFTPPDPDAAAGDSVLRNGAFVRLWAAQVLSQTAQNGLFFALLVLVTERTGSSISGSFLVLAFMLPSVLFSFVAGAFVDRWHKRTVLVVTNVLRAMIAALFLAAGHLVPVLLLLTFCFASVGQFFVPAEASTIPAVVPKRQLISANALFQLTLAGSQFLGLVVLAPALLKIGGGTLFFLAMIVLYTLAALLVSLLPQGFEPPLVHEPLRVGRLFHSVTADLAEALRVIHADRISRLALVQLTMSSSLAMLFGLLVPRFVRDVLGIAPDNAVFVFAPVAVGAVMGLRALSWFTHRMAKQTVVTVGLFGIAASLVALASVEFIGAALAASRAHPLVDALGRAQPHFGALVLSELVLVTMAFAVPIGFFYALVNAPAQTIIHERAPADMRGRYFGTQLLLANASSLVLMLIVGAAADLVGVSNVLLLYAPLVLAVAVYGLTAGRSPGRPAPAESRTPSVH